MLYFPTCTPAVGKCDVQACVIRILFSVKTAVSFRRRRRPRHTCATEVCKLALDVVGSLNNYHVAATYKGMASLHSIKLSSHGRSASATAYVPMYRRAHRLSTPERRLHLAIMWVRMAARMAPPFERWHIIKASKDHQIRPIRCCEDPV